MIAESGRKLDVDSERLAREYEELSATRQLESGKNLLARLGIAPAERVLDVGCGTGLLTQYLADLVARRVWCWVSIHCRTALSLLGKRLGPTSPSTWATPMTFQCWLNHRSTL
jgi:ubiquinone/menaquinone biosynthesis C-methylase UbiE